MKFYICNHCGNIVEKLIDKGVPIVCCGEPMAELIPGTSDGAAEKHVPVYEVKDNIVTVNVGSVDHPMVDEHYIQFVIVETNVGNYGKGLKPGTAPNVKFAITEGESVVAVYEYCNLHGLWKA